jgi:hypothetical protein
MFPASTTPPASPKEGCSSVPDSAFGRNALMIWAEAMPYGAVLDCWADDGNASLSAEAPMISSDFSSDLFWTNLTWAYFSPNC